VKKVLSMVVLAFLLLGGAAYADNVKVRPLSALTLAPGTWDDATNSGVPYAWCNAGGTIDGLALFDVKGTGTVSVKVKVYNASTGALLNTYKIGSDDFSSTSWEGWYIRVSGFPCVTPGVYNVAVQFITPWNGIVKSVSTTVNVLP
jgi:hypothetical protein